MHFVWFISVCTECFSEKLQKFSQSLPLCSPLFPSSLSLSPSITGERVQGFLQAMLQGSSAKGSPDLAAPLRLVSAELTELGTNFRQIVNFNRTVFGPFYAPILRKLMFPSGVGEAWR